MPTITTGLTYTISGLTMPIHPDPKTVEQWCTDNGHIYVSYTTETYDNHVPNKQQRMYATYEDEGRHGYAPTWTGTTGADDSTGRLADALSERAPSDLHVSAVPSVDLLAGTSPTARHSEARNCDGPNHANGSLG